MKSSVLEIKITEDSPLRCRSLNKTLGIGESDKIEPDVVHSMKEEVANAFNLQKGFAELLKRGSAAQVEKIKPQIDWGNSESIKNRINQLESDIAAKKIQFKEIYTRAYKGNKDLKKKLELLQKSSDVSNQSLSKTYNKYITDLRKEELSLKSDYFIIQQRVYNLNLEIAEVSSKIQNVIQEISEIDHLNNQDQLMYRQSITSLKQRKEQLTSEKLALSLANSKLLKKALELVQDAENPIKYMM